MNETLSRIVTIAVVSCAILSVLYAVVISAYAEQILREDHKFGTITKYFEEDKKFDNLDNCISPTPIGRQITPTTSYQFRLIVPDNNYCKLETVILSANNYTKLQNNIGVFTVLDKKQVTASPTHDYCDLALWIWNGETEDYQKILKKYPQKYIFPDECYQEIPTAVIPEFSHFILIFAVVSMILYYSVVRLHGRNL
jgi:hypothetical protein